MAWDGITYVDLTYDPIIAEGLAPARVIFMNAGPWPVALIGWNVTSPSPHSPPEIRLEVRPGNTVAIAANLIRAKLIDASAGVGIAQSAHAAVGWSIVS